MDSMLALLRSFTAVLDEFGVSYGRAKQAALCAGEGLLVAGAVLKEHSATDVRKSLVLFKRMLIRRLNKSG